MKKKIRVGVIGAGFGARVHVPAFRSDKRCEVAGIAAGSKKSGLEAAKASGVSRAYADWQSLVRDPRIDLVSIAVPAKIQPLIIRSAIELKKPFFCEKPLASDAESISELGSANLPHAIDFEFPEIPAWKRARQILESGRLGRIRHAVLSWQVETYANKKKISGWKSESESGGALNLFGSHVFYNLEWLFGPVSALTARLRKAPDLPGSQDSLCLMRLHFEKDFYTQVTIATHCLHGDGHRLEVYGEKGTLVLKNGARDYIDGFELWLGMKKDDGLRRIRLSSGGSRRASDGRIGAVSSLIRRLVSGVASGKTITPGLKEGRRVQRLLDAARESNAGSGKAVFCRFKDKA